MIITTILAVFMCVSVCAQAPQKMSFQAIVRNADNTLVANQNVSARIWVLQGSADGIAVYIETQTVETNPNGLMTLSVGEGTAVSGSFSAIEWANGPYFLKTEIDPAGGSSYALETVQQLMSVPYALYANEAGNGFSGNYNDLINTPEIPTVPTNVSAFNNDAGYLTATTVQDAITIPTNVSAFTNDAGYITASQVPAQVNADWNATSGAAQILNKPAIPAAANNATLTIQQNGNTVGTFTADAATDATINVTVPTLISELTNNSGYITSANIPMNISAYANDAGYITTAQCGEMNICDMANMITSLQTMLEQLQSQLGQMQSRIDTLTGDTTGQ